MATTKRLVKGSALNASEHDANISVIDDNKSKIDALISVDITSAGAIGNGVFNNTTIIQTALDTYDNVLIPSGDFLVTNLTIPENTRLFGDNMYTSKLVSASTGYMLSTENKSYHSVIENLTLSGGDVAKGISINCTDNTDLVEFDISIICHDLLILNTVDKALWLDVSARECRVDNVRCYYGDNGIYIDGTDNWITNSTAASMEYYGFYGSANNKFDSCKAFICGKNAGEPAMWLDRNCVATNICIQQTNGAGLYMKRYGNLFSGVIDSIGYENSFYSESNAVVIEGDFNSVTATVTDGRFDGNMRSVVKLIDGATFNEVNITLAVLNTKTYYDNDPDEIDSLFDDSLNLIKINNIPAVDQSSYTYLDLDGVSFTESYDGTGTATETNGDVDLTLVDDPTPLAVGWGTSARFDILPLNTGSKKYLVVKGRVRIKDETWGKANIALGSTTGQVSGASRIYIKDSVESGQFSYFSACYDLDQTAIDYSGVKLWIGLYKNTSDAVTGTAAAEFRNVEFYFVD